MDKLTIEQLSGYLPHDLGIQVQSVDGVDYETLTALTLSGDGAIATISNTDYYLESEENEFSIKPLLHPLSSLTKTILHKGVEIVPIVELAKADFPIKEWPMQNNRCHADGWKRPLHFVFIGNSFSAYGDANLHVPNQLRLFQMLHEWHFDLYGLLDKNLAIDKASVK